MSARLEIEALRFAADELETAGARVMCANEHADAVATLRAMVTYRERVMMLARLDEARGVPTTEPAEAEGEGWQAERRVGPPAEVAICFATFPGHPVIEQLKSMGLEWNPNVKEWHGAALPGRWESLIAWAQNVRVVVSYRFRAERRYHSSRFDSDSNDRERDDWGGGDEPF